MHEMSIVEALLDAVREEVDEPDLERVTVVSIRLGQLRQVVPELLMFCFQAATRHTALASARLEVEQVPARAWCAVCREEFGIEEKWFECPVCQTPGAKPLQGEELVLKSIRLAAIDKLSCTSM